MLISRIIILRGSLPPLWGGRVQPPPIGPLPCPAEYREEDGAFWACTESPLPESSPFMLHPS